MNARDRDDTPIMKCPCCELVQRQAYDATGVKARVCANCAHHQGDQPTMRLHRAETHERLIREKLTACRASESKAQAELMKARKTTAEAREATAAALRSRGRLAARLIDAAARADNHPCPLGEIAHDPQIIEWAEREGGDGTGFYRSAR